MNLNPFRLWCSPCIKTVENHVAWEPDKYVCGNYFQKQVNNLFYKSLKVPPFGTVLDVGCGDGEYSHFLAKNLKNGTVLGIDKSALMIKHANEHWARSNLSFAEHAIEAYRPSLEFDFILSFWTLHWIEIELSFANIFHALKQGGRLYAVLSSCSSHSLVEIWHELAQQIKYKKLLSHYINPLPQCHDYFNRVTRAVTCLPFQHVQLEIKSIKIKFPHIDYFKHLLITMPFINKLPEPVREELINDMVSQFQILCQRNHGGALYYETRPIFLDAIK